MLTDMSRRISFLMHDISRHSRYWFDARAKSRGLTRAQWRVLISLAHSEESPTQSELADRLDVERITLCRMVDRMAEAGLLERHADPSDRRVWRLQLTDKAAPLVDDLSDIANEMEENMLSPLDAEQREQLTHLLSIVRNHIRSQEERAVQPASAGAGR